MSDTSKLTVGTIQGVSGSDLTIKIPVLTSNPEPTLGVGMIAYINGEIKVWGGIEWRGLGKGVSAVKNGMIVEFLGEAYSGGSNWTNSAPNSIGDATLTGSYTYAADGGGAFRFSGGQAATPAYSAGTNGMTLEVVMFNTATDSATTYGRIIDWNDTTLSLGTTGSRVFRNWFNAGGSRTSEFQVQSSEPGYYNQWNHAMFTYDKANAKGYWNGQEVYSSAKTGDLESAAAPFTIGNGDNYAYSGLIRLIRVYNRGLTATEVTQNFSSVRSKYGISAG